MSHFRDLLPRTVAVIERDLGRLHTGAQVYVSREGNPVADFALGEVRSGLAMRPEILMPWLSAGKPITVVALAQCVERGELAFDEPVARSIPEFAQGGKEAITIRQVLTHTSGLPVMETGWPEASWAEIIQTVCQTPREVDPAERQQAAYQPAATWFLLGEILQRIEGRPFCEILRANVFEPLGLTDSCCGMDETSYEKYHNLGRIGRLYRREQGRLELEAWHTQQWATAGSPGSNCRGPIHDLGRFYEMLLQGGELGSLRLLRPETVEELTSRHRVGLYDETLQHKVDFGLGFLLDSNRYGAETVPYGYGRYCSPRTFGHGGAQASMGFADPHDKLAVAWVCNGRPGEPRHNKRNRQINEAIYEDLGLTEGVP